MKHYRLNYDIGDVARKDTIWQKEGNDWVTDDGYHTMTPRFWFWNLLEQETADKNSKFFTEVEQRITWVDVE